MFKKTYEWAVGPPPMTWAEYANIINNKWSELLNSESSKEEVFQSFLEQHPCMLPGPFGLIGTSGHSPYPAAAISQPFLPDFTRRVPDFMWIARTSDTIYPILIEIESPAKPWFTKDDVQHSKLTQARDQITEWRSWFQNPLNVARLKDYYEIEVRGENIQPLFLLIYGRRQEANSSVERQRRRSNMAREDEFIMTYDRLVPQHGASQFYTVKVDRSGYCALYIPPTAELGPMFAGERAKFRDRQIAVTNSPYFTPERREFFIRRLEYWDKWTLGPHGIIYTGDRE
jgi:hypothetical protein